MEAVSISGAAVAPVMGRMTRAPFRFLLALANVRLGVWMLKPNQVALPPEPDPSAAAAASEDGRRLPKHVGPGLMYLVHEAHGTPPVKAHYVYVTDGGHYDNLGLVDLLEQRCEWIWCIDASGDQIDSFSTLGQAVALAQAEFGILIDVHPDQDMKPAVPKYWVKQPYCTAKITYPKTADHEAAEGTLVVVKAGVPRGAPWAVEYYRNSNPKFPCDSTVDQLFTAEQFDAYVALGNFAMGEAFANDAIRDGWAGCAERQRARRG
jgi:hypothetical protein